MTWWRGDRPFCFCTKPACWYCWGCNERFCDFHMKDHECLLDDLSKPLELVYLRKLDKE